MHLLPMSEWHAADALVSPADADIAVALPITEEDGDAEVGASTMLFGASILWVSLAFVCYVCWPLEGNRVSLLVVHTCVTPWRLILDHVRAVWSLCRKFHRACQRCTSAGQPCSL